MKRLVLIVALLVLMIAAAMSYAAVLPSALTPMLTGQDMPVADITARGAPSQFVSSFDAVAFMTGSRSLSQGVTVIIDTGPTMLATGADVATQMTAESQVRAQMTTQQMATRVKSTTAQIAALTTDGFKGQMAEKKTIDATKPIETTSATSSAKQTMIPVPIRE